MSLEQAPDEVKLAVDLIMLLEEHAIAPQTVLKALEIVRRDFENKLAAPEA
ncbi:pleiotropic regulatory protein RsmS [Siccibacter turicensis]|uniref:pleiotropic regulatory protein RsmS n=1 Tax=Siccibacter turicensis TaxID=357233 RepID=UPI002A6ABA2D|nr:pleiotropic regulatory protein RsmS [Siccibacter turicensis]MDY0970551.1 pleiotropic regulatory protein RsmS [Siccibacter turicensis]